MADRPSITSPGFIASSAGAFWGALVLTVTFALDGGWSAPIGLLALFATIFLYGGIVTLALTWTVGLAWYAISQRLRWQSFAAYVAAGAVSGLAISLLVASRLPAPGPTGAFIIAYLSSCAIVVSTIGWLIRRPDRDQPLSASTPSNDTSA